MKLRDLVAHTLDTSIDEGGIGQTIERLSVSGRVGVKAMLDLIVLLCDKVDEMEQSPPTLDSIITNELQTTIQSPEIRPKTDNVGRSEQPLGDTTPVKRDIKTTPKSI